MKNFKGLMGFLSIAILSFALNSKVWAEPIQVEGRGRIIEVVGESKTLTARLVAKDIALDDAEKKCDSVLLNRVSLWKISKTHERENVAPWRTLLKTEAAATFQCEI